MALQMAQDMPLLEELRKLQETGASGVLLVSRAEERLSISYLEGIILSASLNLETHRLGAFLTRAGLLLNNADIPKILTEARQKKLLFGEAAVNRKFIDSQELAEAVRMQAIDLLKYALTNGFVPESFTSGVRSSFASAGISLEYVLLEMSRSNKAPLDCDSTTVLTLRAGKDLSGVPWLPKELSVLGELDGASNIVSLISSTGLDEPALRRILGVFQRLGILEEIGNGTSPEVSSAFEETGLVKKSPFPLERLVPVVSNAVIGEELEMLNNPSSVISEQFKTLKVRLREDFKKTPPRVLTFSSPEQQDGKSLVSANFALTLSMEPGRRTVIVDCDLRSPSLNRYLGVAPTPGLIQHLVDGQFSPYCFMRRIGNLFFMTSGGISEHPIELLSLRKMKELVESLRTDFDTVIFDAPPIFPIADARIISGLSDGLIMVIRRGKTSNRSTESAFKAIGQDRLLGVVFNDVQPTLLNSYFNGYYYNYGSYSRKVESAKPRLQIAPKDYLDS
jgi:capsular exopolysaccharide synthesis family protein